MKRLFNVTSPRGGAGAPHEWVGKEVDVGRHRVVVDELVAEGGFALVFLVRTRAIAASNDAPPYFSDNNDNRLALKRMYVNNANDLKVCQREIRVLRLLKGRNPCVIEYADSAVKPVREGVYEVLILTRFYAGGPLLNLMNSRHDVGRKLSKEEVLSIFCDVCEAVATLHHSDPPLIHRDLKVENILVDDRRRRHVLCDFGSCLPVAEFAAQSLAVMEEEVKRYTTASYRAPELVARFGDAAPITCKADVWSLGVLLYKLCYFSLPFGESAVAIENAKLTFPESPNFGEPLLALIRYLLTKDVNSRPDIYQVSYVASRLAGKANPVVNVNRVPTPDINAILKAHRAASTATRDARGNESQKALQRPVAAVIESTTVKPRERPKGSGIGNANNLHIFAGNTQKIDSVVERSQALSGRGPTTTTTNENDLIQTANIPSQMSSADVGQSFNSTSSAFKVSAPPVETTVTCSVPDADDLITLEDATSRLEDLNFDPLISTTKPHHTKSKSHESILPPTLTSQPNFFPPFQQPQQRASQPPGAGLGFSAAAPGARLDSQAFPTFVPHLDPRLRFPPSNLQQMRHLDSPARSHRRNVSDSSAMFAPSRLGNPMAPASWRQSTLVPDSKSAVGILPGVPSVQSMSSLSKIRPSPSGSRASTTGSNPNFSPSPESAPSSSSSSQIKTDLFDQLPTSFGNSLDFAALESSKPATPQVLHHPSQPQHGRSSSYPWVDFENPFGDAQNFGDWREEDFFGKEFDKIRN